MYVIKGEKDEKGATITRLIPCQKAVEPKLKRTHLVCIDENGELTSSDTIKYMSRIINKEMSIKFNFHALRHTHATQLIESGVSPKTVQMRLGHKHIETTLQTYVHDTDKMKDDSVSTIEKNVHGLNLEWTNRGQMTSKESRFSV